MRNGIRRALNGLVIVIASTALSTSLHAQVAGEWQQAAIDAIQQTSDKCSSIWISERKLVLSPQSNGTLGGFFMRRDWGQWLMKLDSSCRLPGTQPSQEAFQRLRKWTVLAVPAGPSRWKIGSQFQGCSFQGCDQPMFADNFEVTVELQRDRLVEVKGDADLFSYRRAAQVAALSREAEAAFRKAVSDFDEGNCLRFYNQNFMPGAVNQQATASLCQSYENLRRGLPAVTSTDIIYRGPIDGVMGANRHYMPVDDHVLLGFVNRSDGSAQPRGAIMHKAGDQWLIVRMLTP